MALRMRRSIFMQEYFSKQKDEEAQLTNVIETVITH